MKTEARSFLGQGPAALPPQEAMGRTQLGQADIKLRFAEHLKSAKGIGDSTRGSGPDGKREGVGIPPEPGLPMPSSVLRYVRKKVDSEPSLTKDRNGSFREILVPLNQDAPVVSTVVSRDLNSEETMVSRSGIEESSTGKDRAKDKELNLASQELEIVSMGSGTLLDPLYVFGALVCSDSIGRANDMATEVSAEPVESLTDPLERGRRIRLGSTEEIPRGEKGAGLIRHVSELEVGGRGDSDGGRWQFRRMEQGVSPMSSMDFPGEMVGQSDSISRFASTMGSEREMWVAGPEEVRNDALDTAVEVSGMNAAELAVASAISTRSIDDSTGIKDFGLEKRADGVGEVPRKERVKGLEESMTVTTEVSSLYSAVPSVELVTFLDPIDGPSASEVLWLGAPAEGLEGGRLRGHVKGQWQSEIVTPDVSLLNSGTLPVNLVTSSNVMDRSTAIKSWGSEERPAGFNEVVGRGSIGGPKGTMSGLEPISLSSPAKTSDDIVSLASSSHRSSVSRGLRLEQIQERLEGEAQEGVIGGQEELDIDETRVSGLSYTAAAVNLMRPFTSNVRSSTINDLEIANHGKGSEGGTQRNSFEVREEALRVPTDVSPLIFERSSVELDNPFDSNGLSAPARAVGSEESEMGMGVEARNGRIERLEGPMERATGASSLNSGERSDRLITSSNSIDRSFVNNGTWPEKSETGWNVEARQDPFEAREGSMRKFEADTPMNTGASTAPLETSSDLNDRTNSEDGGLEDQAKGLENEPRLAPIEGQRDSVADISGIPPTISMERSIEMDTRSKLVGRPPTEVFQTKNGTRSAIQGERMKLGQKMESSAELDGTILPDAGPRRETSVGGIPTALEGRREEVGKFGTDPVLQPVFSNSPTRVDAPNPPDMVAPHPDLLSSERIARAVLDGVAQVRHLGTESISVVLRPEPGTELVLHVKFQDGAVNAELHVGRGDSSLLDSHWNELHYRLGDQGIRLSRGSEISLGENSRFEHSQSRPELTDDNLSRGSAKMLKHNESTKSLLGNRISHGFDSWA